MKLALAQQMRDLDSSAIHDFGIPGIVLMENAGRKTTDLLIKRYGDPAGKKIIIFAGPGNNGGDGFVVARHLHQKRADVVVYLLVAPDKITGDAQTNLEIVKKLPIEIHTILNSDEISRVDISSAFFIVDGLFGTGLKRDVRGHYAEVITIINNSNLPVAALDIPSGLDSDTGSPLGSCIAANVTYTYGLAKPGQFSYPGKDLCGILEVIDIGIPSEVVVNAQLHLELLNRESVSSMVPDRLSAGHKGSHGHMLVVAGSVGKTGAAILAAQGGLRAGAGLVSLCAPAKVNDIYESALFEAMTVLIQGTELGAPSIHDFKTICEAMEGKKAVVVGPGIGQEAESVDLIKKIYTEATSPLVIDADGLNALTTETGVLSCNDSTIRILTPHPGEMSRLTGLTTTEIQKSRIKVAREFACQNNVYLVLKGAATVIAGPDGSVAINNSGNAGMGTGGMGDVLSGIIGGLLVQGLSPWQAACLGVYCHGRAGDIVASTMKQGYLASEVAQIFPQVLSEIQN
jgi:NAD(P)H-hydrate epimerase